MDTPEELECEDAYLELVDVISKQAVEEFTQERLSSYYTQNPNVMRPAVDAIEEGVLLKKSGHPAAAVIFFVTAIELFLKATVLKPVVHGLVHHTALADIIVEHALGQAGFDRYTKLLSTLYKELSQLDINLVQREDASQNLLKECAALQKLRNSVIHQGATCPPENADWGLAVALAVYDRIVFPVLVALNLTANGKGLIEHRRF